MQQFDFIHEPLKKVDKQQKENRKVKSNNDVWKNLSKISFFFKILFIKGKEVFDWIKNQKTLFAFLHLIAHVIRVHHKLNWLIHKTLKCTKREKLDDILLRDLVHSFDNHLGTKPSLIWYMMELLKVKRMLFEIA